MNSDNPVTFIIKIKIVIRDYENKLHLVAFFCTNSLVKQIPF